MRLKATKKPCARQCQEVITIADNKRSFRSTFSFEGKRYERTGKTQKEADQKAALYEAQLERGEIGISNNMTVSRWADEWLETYKRPAIGDGQYNNYCLYLSLITKAIGSLSLRSVKTIHLQKIINARKGKSKSDLHKLRYTMHGLFQRALTSRLITVNPADNLELPAAKDGTHRAITDYERRHILSLVETHHAGLWLKIMLYCGLRPNECRALDWQHIDFDKKLIHVMVAMKAGTKTIDDPKTDAGIRDVPIPDVLLADLLAIRGEPFQPVLTKPKAGGRHDKASMYNMWRNFKRHLDISMGAVVYRNKITMSVVAGDLEPYDIRHTYCTDLQDAGVPINIAKVLLGHSSIAVTANIYTHTTKESVDIAAKLINQHIG